MSMDKALMYNVKFSVRTLQANCQRASCKVHIFIKIQNQQRKLKEIAEMKKNVAVFNSDMVWDFVPIKYDEVSGTFLDTPAILSIHYETSEQGARTNKLKVGQVTVNLAKLLNSKTYRINSQYNVEKCYDPNAKLKLAIDLTQVDETQNIQMHSEQGISEYRSVARQSGVNWRVSKIRQKMNEDEKVMLQNKLYEYEDKMEKYRDAHNEQIKRLSEQIEKKQERILSITAQNVSMAQALQNCQVQLQKHKGRVGALEKQNLEFQEAIRQSTQSRESLSRQLAKVKGELDEANTKVEQLEGASYKKEQHYKLQLQKYTQRYMESENGRNKIVFELESKLKEQLQKKDQHYAELLAKLEGKVQLHGLSSKETISKKEKELVVLIERHEKIERERNNFEADLKQIEEQRQEWANMRSELEDKINSLVAKNKNLESQYEMCSFSNSNLQRELQRIKSEGKIQTKSMEELKYEIQLANKTMEEQESMIVKLNREIKTHKEREYYMEEKYQDELEQKTYNEECIKGSNYFYKGQVKKHQIKIKFLQEKIEDAQTAIANSNKEKEKLQQEIKNSNRVIFENGHQILRLQSENKKLTEKLDELEFEKNHRQTILKDTEQKFAAHIVQHDQQVNDYIVTINQLERQVKEISQRRTEDANHWELQFQSESNEKNNLLSQLQMELQKLKISEKGLRERLVIKDQKELQLENQLSEQKQKTRNLERQAVKTKFQLKRWTDQKQSFSRQQSKYKKLINELKSEVSSSKSELQKMSKRVISQKQSYVGLIKWILDRNWEDGNKQFVRQASPEIELEMITFVNTGLERIYSVWERSIKKLQQVQQENERMAEQIARLKLEQQYQEQFAKNDRIELELHSIQYRIDHQIVQPKPLYKMPQPIIDLSSSFEGHKSEEVKNMNSQLQREITMKNSQIQNLNQQLFQERTKSRQLSDELRSIKEEVEDLNMALSKKTALINSLQAQFAERDIDMSGSLSYLGSRSPPRAVDHKAEVEAKYKEQKAVASLQSKVEELSRQNGLQKSKLDLLETRLKMSTEKNLSDSQKISSLQKTLKEKQEQLRKITKESEEKQTYLDKVKKDIEIALSKVSKKDANIEELKLQIQQYKRMNQMLAQQVEDWEKKLAQKQKLLQKQSSANQKLLLETAQTLASQKMERQKLNLQQVSQIANLKGSLKQAERRIGSLEGLLKRSKQQNEQLYEKHLRLVQSLSEAQQTIKDMRMSENLTKQNTDKIISDLNERLQTKEFELEEVRFSSESKIMQLEKQLEEK